MASFRGPTNWTETFARAYKAGVNIAFGTDSGVSPHGDNWRSSSWHAGGDSIGDHCRCGFNPTLPGKFADVIAVVGNPLPAMGEVGFVMKDGCCCQTLGNNTALLRTKNLYIKPSGCVDAGAVHAWGVERIYHVAYRVDADDTAIAAHLD